MVRGVSLTLLAVMAAVLAFAMPAAPAHAQSGRPETVSSQCHAATGQDAAIEDMLSDARWTCSDEAWDASKPVAWLRFEAASWGSKPFPQYFFTRVARYENITIAAIGEDGAIRRISYAEADGNPFAGGPVFQLKLPELKADTATLLVRIERPHSVPMLTDARLSYKSGQGDWSQSDMMVIALVLGMLILPLLFDISFFMVLRERFVALHAVMVGAMIGYVLFAGGLISAFGEVPMRLIAVAGPLSWVIGCGMSTLFLAEFLEKGAQSQFMRRVTLWVSYWTFAVPGFCALQFHTTQAYDDALYFWAFLPTLATITVAIFEALLRGSHSARFIAFAWAPILFASAERVLRGLGVYSGPSTLDLGLYVAAAIEVIIISLAIAARFLAIRLERDAALREAKALQTLSTQDQLTGLMNRRAVEERFGDLRAQGFDTFALIDLDHFKQVNDRFGHQAGDNALVACAKALRGSENRDTVAVRLGGEEFVVLLRGSDALNRAEALRRMIPVRIARDVEGLDRPVTASMGVIELPRASDHLMDFNTFYARADQLLYNAKAAGRNRVCFERVTVFDKRPQERRRTPRSNPGMVMEGARDAAKNGARDVA